MGVKACDELDWLSLSAYMAGGVIGVYFNYWVKPVEKKK